MQFMESGDPPLAFKMFDPNYDRCIQYRCMFRASSPPHCREYFNTKQELDEHLKSHNICQFCLKMTDREEKKAFQLHLYTGHKEIFRCNECIDLFLEKNFNQFKEHQSDRHENEREKKFYNEHRQYTNWGK
eukprot:TRINITY_DN613_c0_g1_i1.p1 TRINITY_DN613_c0_g1~~TRINITY_DN613_c0_g1_i1.p1  ORF type:complete len:131 (-),score=22.46 TRINITY_DN613_c0_g1_i1:368-760(-)